MVPSLPSPALAKIFGGDYALDIQGMSVPGAPISQSNLNDPSGTCARTGWRMSLFMATVLGDRPLRPLASQSATALSTVYPAFGLTPASSSSCSA